MNEPAVYLHNIAHLDDVTDPDDRLTSIWGYVDAGGAEYALVGRRNRTDVVDISTDATVPVVVATIPGPRSNWRDIKVSGAYAFIVHDHVDAEEQHEGIQIVDLSVPADAAVVARYRSNFEHAYNIHIDGNYLYACDVSTTSDGVVPLVILDITTPTTPVEVGVYRGDSIQDVYVNDGLAYAAAGRLPGVIILDVSDKQRPIECGRIQTPEDNGHSTWLSEDGRHLFVVNEGWGGHLRIYDVTDLANPFPVSNYRVAQRDALVRSVSVRGSFAYLAHYTEGVIVLDVSDPVAPQEIASHKTNVVEFADPYHGVCGVYPFFPSGRLAVCDIEHGMFLFALAIDT